jgi:peptidoglycan hydrolase-like protein with peptidoglycan-binding domain
MESHRNGRFGRPMALVWAALLASAPLPVLAQQRVLLPEGTVLTVRTEAGLNSSAVQVGQTFNTLISEPVTVEGYSLLPAGTRIQGQVSVVRPATSQNSGIIGIEFNQLTLPNGRAVTIDGKLTSTDPAERRQIETQADPRVVLVGGRRGVGAAIAGIGATGDPVSGVLGALGSILSKGADVNVPAGTTMAVQLERGLTLVSTGNVSTSNSSANAFTLYTSAEMIRAAQQALRDQDYYRGPMDGRLSDATQRALFEYQIDNRIIATGNLDGRTALALGLSLTGTGSALAPAEAALVRRNAQTVVGRWREHLGVNAAGRLDPRRSYQPRELELYFALSGFADNASLYEQMVRLSGNAEGVTAASEALVASAERVDQALRGVSAPARITSMWQAVRDELGALDPTLR